jgi:hypothetical protein
MRKVVGIIAKAHELTMQIQNGEVDDTLAEELSGECAEFLALWDGDYSSFDGESLDKNLLKLIKKLKRM